MTATRRMVLLVLLLLPVLVYVGFGVYALWETGWLLRIGWSLPVLWGVTWVVARLWTVPSVDQRVTAEPFSVPTHWTKQDEQAVAIVQKYQQEAATLDIEQLMNPHLCLNTSMALAVDLATHFHPRERDPINSVTAPEVLAAVRLALDELEPWVLRNVPGSQLVTIGQWRMLAGATRWVERGTNAFWVTSIVLNPVSVLNYLASKYAVAPVVTEVQRDFATAIYQRYLRLVGFYLIEMNSGRLRGGAELFRQTFEQYSAVHPVGTKPVATQELQPESLSIALLGQVKAGKSSLVNALLDQYRAETDVLPKTRSVQRFACVIPETTEKLTLLDTPGYGESGATSAQLAEIQAAVEAADLVLLVMAANSPAKEADAQLLQQLASHYARFVQLKAPPVVAVLTHIDLLSPRREWSPPYNWRAGQSPKEQSIRGAVDYIVELFGDQIAAVVPVCTSADSERQVGVLDELLPALIPQLNPARSSAVLKAYHKHLSSDRLTALLNQLRNSGGTLLKWWIEERLLPWMKQ